MHAAQQEMIAVIEETAQFLKRLNWNWFKELEMLILEGQAVSATNKETLHKWYEKVKFTLEGEKQLGSLFVSSPLKREEFKQLKSKWKQKLASFENLK